MQCVVSKEVQLIGLSDKYLECVSDLSDEEISLFNLSQCDFNFTLQPTSFNYQIGNCNNYPKITLSIDACYSESLFNLLIKLSEYKFNININLYNNDNTTQQIQLHDAEIKLFTVLEKSDTLYVNIEIVSCFEITPRG